MNRINIRGQLTNFILYLALQIYIAKPVAFFYDTYFFIYVAFLLMLPLRGNIIILLLVSFLTGFVVDIFYDSLGIHTFASVLMVYSRALLIKRIVPTSSYGLNTQPALRIMGFSRFTLFALLLILIHHTALFLWEVGSLSILFTKIRKVVFSSFITYLAILITQPIFHASRRNRRQ